MVWWGGGDGRLKEANWPGRQMGRRTDDPRGQNPVRLVGRLEAATRVIAKSPPLQSSSQHALSLRPRISTYCPSFEGEAEIFPFVTRINGLANCRALKLRSPSIIVHHPRLTYVVNYAKWLQRVVWPRNTPTSLPLSPLLTLRTHSHTRTRSCRHRRNISSIKRW